MKFLILLMLLVPALLLGAEEEKSDDHNNIPPGLVSRDQILTLEVYSRRYTDYTPKPEAVEAIHSYAGKAEIKVVFGDWCKDSKHHVPAFLKTMEAADNKNLQIVYLNVDRQKKEPADLLAGLNISAVPTFIVTADGQEIGRIVETPKASVEEDLAGILGVAAH